jgi:hypothetical protein
VAEEMEIETENIDETVHKVKAAALPQLCQNYIPLCVRIGKMKVTAPALSVDRFKWWPMVTHSLGTVRGLKILVAGPPAGAFVSGLG